MFVNGGLIQSVAKKFYEWSRTGMDRLSVYDSYLMWFVVSLVDLRSFGDSDDGFS